MYKPFNAITLKPYNGNNIAILTATAKALGHLDDPRWLTFKQAEDIGQHVKKGAKGTRIEFAKTETVIDKDGKEARRFTHRTYVVFHASQVTGFKIYEA